MFYIKYTFQKGGPEYSCEYPEEDLKKYNIFIAKGPNDKGKSTMMQMIAYGLYGLDYDDISDALKEKMKRLTSETTDKCEFDYEITSYDGITNLKSILKDKNSHPKVFVNNKIRGRDYIKENYKIIYDTPEDPSKKLESSLSNIKENFKYYKELIITFNGNIQKMIDLIDNINNRETNISDQESLIKRKKGDLQQLNTRKSNLEKVLPTYQKAYDVITHNNKVKEKTILDGQINELKKTIKEQENKGAGGGNRAYQTKIVAYNTNLSEIKLLLTHTKMTRRLNADQKAEFDEIKERFGKIILPKHYDSQLVKKSYVFFDELNNRLTSLPLYQKKLEEEEKRDLFKRLIEILKSFIETKIEIPGTNGKNIAEFIDELETKYAELDKSLEEKKHLKEDVQDCENIIIKINAFIDAKRELPENIGIMEGYEGLKKELLTKEKRSNVLFNEISSYNDKILDIPLKERKSLEVYGDSIFGLYTDTKNELEKLQQRVNSINQTINDANDAISALKQSELKMPQYTKENLIELQTIASRILQKIISGSRCIESIYLKDNKSFETEPGWEDFLNALSIYFAEIIKLVFFEGKSWEVTKIDIKKKLYEVKERKPIEFVDIGRGHTELNSLLARLKQPSMGKKKIILFDEMSTMDSRNLTLLIDEIKNQVRNGEAIFAFLNRPDDTIKEVIFEGITV